MKTLVILPNRGFGFMLNKVRVSTLDNSSKTRALNNILLTLIVDPDIDALGHSDVARDVEIISVGRALSEFPVKAAESDRTQATIKWLETIKR